MGLTTRKSWSKIESAGFSPSAPTDRPIAPRVCSAYNLRPRPQPGPNYRETRVSRRWTRSKRKQKTRSGARRGRAKKSAPLVNESGDHQVDPTAATPTKLCPREDPEPMDVDEVYATSDAQANDRLVEAVENMCTAFEIVDRTHPDVWASPEVQVDADVWMRMFPEYAHELSSGISDYTIVDLTNDPNIYYRIPVIEGGVVTPSWEEARCVVKQEMDDDYVLPQDLPDIYGKGNETPVEEMPVYSEKVTQQVSQNSTIEFNNNNDNIKNTETEEEEEYDWLNEAEDDTDSTLFDVHVADENNAGETNEPVEHPQDDSDSDKPSDPVGFGMFFGEGARINWPSPTVFSHEQQNDYKQSPGSHVD